MPHAGHLCAAGPAWTHGPRWSISSPHVIITAGWCSCAHHPLWLDQNVNEALLVVGACLHSIASPAMEATVMHLPVYSRAYQMNRIRFQWLKSNWHVFFCLSCLSCSGPLGPWVFSYPESGPMCFLALSKIKMSKTFACSKKKQLLWWHCH